MTQIVNVIVVLLTIGIVASIIFDILELHRLRDDRLTDYDRLVQGTSGFYVVLQTVLVFYIIKGEVMAYKTQAIPTIEDCIFLAILIVGEIWLLARKIKRYQQNNRPGD